MNRPNKTYRWETYFSMFVTYLLILKIRVSVYESGGEVSSWALLALAGFTWWGMTELLITFRSRRKQRALARRFQSATG